MYVSINNFKYGLDSRRSELSSLPGTLVQATDGHINEGGEFEKRLAFTQVNGSGRPSGTFGLEVTGQGLVLFGSTATPGGMALGALVSGSSVYNFNAGLNYPNVYYQRLIHPSALFGNASPPALTSVLCSTSFGGNTWVAAQFADGSVFAFWNGVAIPAWYNGTAMTGVSNSQGVASTLQAMVGTLSGFSVGAVTLSGGSYYFDMWSTAGLQYSLVTGLGANNQNNGTIKATNISSFLPGITGASSTSNFTVVAGSFAGSGGISSIQVYDQVSAGWIEILGATVSFTAGQSVAQFVNNVTAQLATYQSTLLITALASNQTVNLSFDVSLGAAPNGDNIRITTLGDCCVDNTVFNFIYTTSPIGYTCTHLYMPTQTTVASAVGSYSSGGTKTITLVANTYYYYKQGANDISITYGSGSTVLSTSGVFLNDSTTTATLTGVHSAVITAAVLPYVDVVAATVTAGASVNSWVAAIAAQIQTHGATLTPKFTANAVGPVLTVSRMFVDTSLPSGANAIIVVSSGIIVDGSGATPPALIPLSLAISPSPANFQIINASTTFPVVASAVGGVAPYNFTWALVSSPLNTNSPNINVPSNTMYANQVTFSGKGGLPGVGVYTCTVVDSNGLTAFATVQVTAHQ